MLDQQRQERKDVSSYSYYTSSEEDEPGEPVRLIPKAEVKEDPTRIHRLLSRHLMMMKERKRNLRQILMKRPEKQSRRTRKRVQMNLHNLSCSSRTNPRLHLVSQHLLPRASLLLLKRRGRKFQCNSLRDHRRVHPRPCHLHWPGRKRRDLPMIGRR